MAVALDIAKVTTVTFLYRHWTEIKWTMKSYMLSATLVLMLITSSGVFGYLSGEFQKAISSTSQQTVLIQSLTEEQSRLQKRKEEIDKQIAQLPQNAVRGRRQLIQQFGPEVNRLNDRLTAIDKQLPELKVASIDKDVHVGPIMYVAEAFHTTPQEAVKWVIFTIIGVFDPLAIALLVAGNFLLLRKKEEPQNTANTLSVPRAEADPDEIWEEVPIDYQASPQQPTIHELIDKPETRKFELPVPPIPEAIPVAQEPIMFPDFEVPVPPIPDEPTREKVVIKASPKKPRALKVQESDGKEVITLTPEPLTRSSLEDIKVRGDVEFDNQTNSSNRHRTYHD
jgi:hypothetical protein